LLLKISAEIMVQRSGSKAPGVGKMTAMGKSTTLRHSVCLLSAKTRT